MDVPAARLFSGRSFWNARVPVNATVDPRSKVLVAALAQEVGEEESNTAGPWINTTNFSVPLYIVAPHVPTVRVALDRTSPALQRAFDSVPLPRDARPARGSDKHLVVFQPSSRHLWEFWHLRKDGQGWRASWGGAIRDEATDPGAYGQQAWAGAGPSWGASASSLSIAGGLITFGDLSRGEIDHALALAIPVVRAGVYASPARRTDGTSTASTAIPEGAHLRLDPTLDVAALNLPQPTRLLAEAAQKYGIFIRDKAAEITFYAQDPSNTDSEPYAGSRGYLQGLSPSQLLSVFPWDHLQLLQMRLHKATRQP